MDNKTSRSRLDILAEYSANSTCLVSYILTANSDL